MKHYTKDGKLAFESFERQCCKERNYSNSGLCKEHYELSCKEVITIDPR